MTKAYVMLAILSFIGGLCLFGAGFVVGYSKSTHAIAVMPCKQDRTIRMIKDKGWGFSDAWYEGKHQGGGGDDEYVSAGTHLPPPDPPAVVHHPDAIPTRSILDIGLGDPPNLHDDREDLATYKSFCSFFIGSPTCTNKLSRAAKVTVGEEIEEGGHPF